MKKIFALGFFDGVHLGHQALLKACVQLARAQDATPCAITFNKHPQAYFTDTPPALLLPTYDRQRLLIHYGMKEASAFPVNEETMSTPWQAFLDRLLEMGAVGFVCGDDFRFGHRGEGNAERLAGFCRERALPYVIVPEQTLDGVRISSTHIRALIENSDMETAAAFLGHPHILSGCVVPGRQLGRTIGVPTANILIPEGVVVPKLGVYACTCELWGREYVAVTNIGSRPTVDGHQVRAESWILDFDGDLYDSRIVLKFHKFLRPEQKFASLEELRLQIQADAAEAYKLLR